MVVVVVVFVGGCWYKKTVDIFNCLFVLLIFCCCLNLSCIKDSIELVSEDKRAGWLLLLFLLAVVGIRRCLIVCSSSFLLLLLFKFVQYQGQH